MQALQLKTAALDGSGPRDAGAWAPHAQRLRFTLGEFRLFSWRFPAMVLNAHFTELAGHPEESAPFDCLSREAQALVIPSFPVESNLPPLTRLPEALRYVPWHYNHYYTELCAPSLAAFLQTLASKTRHEHQRKVRKYIEKVGKIDCREYRRPEEMEEFHRLALALSKRTYQDKLLNAGLPEGDEFLRELAANAGCGLVRGYLLFHEGNPIAYGYCCGHGDILYYQQTGYDPEFSGWSPGIVLLEALLESALAERKFRLLDFGHGNAQWKRSYATGSSPCAAVYYFRPTLRNFLFVNAHRYTIAISDAAVRALERLGVKARLKKLFRSL